jgi:Domain of unknown function (DUF4291)
MRLTSMKLIAESYLSQVKRLPQSGRYILAQFDEESIIVYQAYRPEIGNFASQHGYFGKDFSFTRMSWIKPNFLWMMYRSGWGTKKGQEVILAVRIKRDAFEYILANAVPSSFIPELYLNREKWKQAISESAVRLQWDPDHHPSGAKLERRAVQLGLRGDVLRSYARDWIIDIEDISEFVCEQYHNLSPLYDRLIVPQENIYPVSDVQIVTRLQLSSA